MAITILVKKWRKTLEKIKPLVSTDSEVNMFCDEDVKIADRLHPVNEESHLAWLLNQTEEYSFERKIIPLDDIVPPDSNINPNGVDSGSQTARQGYNPAGTKIAHSIETTGVDLSQITITLNKVGSNGHYKIESGFGRYRALRLNNFANVLAFVPNKKVSDGYIHQMSQHANDHLPMAPISKADIIEGFIKAAPKGLVAGITKELYIKYSKSTATAGEVTQYVKSMKTYIKAVGRNNHRNKAIDSMISDISILTKQGVSDVHLFEDNEKLVEWLTTLHDNFGSDINPNCNKNVVLPMLNDGTRHAENVLGSIVKKYVDAVDATKQMLLEHNMDGESEPQDIRVIFGMSKWSPETVYSKMNSIKKIYKMRDTFYKFLRNIETMVKQSNVFIDSDENTIPKIDFGGFINPWKTLEKYGWQYKGIITWDNHNSFNDVVESMHVDGMLTEDERNKLRLV